MRLCDVIGMKQAKQLTDSQLNVICME